MGVNKAILIGNLGKDPDVRRTANGTPVANFTLATSERYTDKAGQKQEKTEWHNIVVWNKLAEFAEKWLKKGKTVYVEGRIQTRSYGDEGNKKYITEIVADSVQFVGSSGDSDRGGNRASNGPPPHTDDDFASFGGGSSSPSGASSAPAVEDDLPF